MRSNNGSLAQKSRRICVVTTSRADYWLLRWLMEEIRDDGDLELQVAVTGMHLSPEFGLTCRAIEEDGFEVAARVEMLLSSDTGVGTAKSVGVGVLGFADAFQRLAPDIVVLLGDRFELLSAAVPALTLAIPIAHLHGERRAVGPSTSTSATRSPSSRPSTSRQPRSTAEGSSRWAKTHRACSTSEPRGWTGCGG